MTTTQQNAHATNTGVTTVLGDHSPATEQTLQGNKLLIDIYNLVEPNSLLDIQYNIAPTTGEHAGDYQQTTGTVGAILHNRVVEAISIACFTPNDSGLPFVTDTSQSCALFLGTPQSDYELVIVDNYKDGVTLAKHFKHEKIIVAVSPTPYLFLDTVKHFAHDSQVTIFPSIEHKDKVKKQFAGCNVKVVIAPLGVITHLECGISYAEILTYDDTQIIDLKVLEWGQPESLANEPSKPTPYPIEAWPPILRKPIEAIAYYAQVPTAMAGQAILGAIAHIGQAHVDAPMGYSHKPTSLIIITEGESGTGKTQVMGLSHYKIQQHEKQQYADYLLELSSWETQKASLKNNERAAFLESNPKPFNPVNLFDDATIEPLIDRFVDGEMFNASLSTDEAAQFFEGHSMKGETAGNSLSALTKLYSNGEAGRTRSQKNAYANPRTKAYDVRMTLLLQGQRVVLEKALTDPLMSGQGFLARAMIACPEDLRGKRTWNDPKRNNDSPHDNPALLAYWARCSVLLDPIPADIPTDNVGAPKRIKMQWGKGAKQAFDDGAQAIEDSQASGQVLQYLKEYASRMAENATRIASLMAFFDGRYIVTLDDIERAFLLVQYSTAERLRYLDATPTGEQNNSEKLNLWLLDKARDKTPHKLNRTYVANNAPNPMRNNTKLLQYELDKLESTGHIKQELDGRRKVIAINPNSYN
uniref:DUF3987 domain-containing protein n=1 Tax=Psychrobacter sp. TaxID=56811 RepID=UPI00159AD13B|nr:DUF3987 domain-containing protein [Psychrobacter sp.]QJS05579.1 hypothetical protein [Psychrobacter sp.]